MRYGPRSSIGARRPGGRHDHEAIARGPARGHHADGGATCCCRRSAARRPPQSLVDMLMALDRLAVGVVGHRCRPRGRQRRHRAPRSPGIGHPVEGLATRSARRRAAVDVAALAAEQPPAQGRRWSAAIEALDLPAGPDDPPDAPARADHEVRRAARPDAASGAARPPADAAAAEPAQPRRSPASTGRRARGDDGGAASRSSPTEMPDARDVRVDRASTRWPAGRRARRSCSTSAGRRTTGTVEERCVMLRQPVSSVLESDESATSFTGSRRVPEVEFRMLRCMEAAGVPVPAHAVAGADRRRPRTAVQRRPADRRRGRPHQARRRAAPRARARAVRRDPRPGAHARPGRLPVSTSSATPRRETAASVQVELFADGRRAPAARGVPRPRLPGPVAAQAPADGRSGERRPRRLPPRQLHVRRHRHHRHARLGAVPPRRSDRGAGLHVLAAVDARADRADRGVRPPLRGGERDHGRPGDARVLPGLHRAQDVGRAAHRHPVVLRHRRAAARVRRRASSLAMLCECQLRFVDELLHGGPTVRFGSDRVAQPA